MKKIGMVLLCACMASCAVPIKTPDGVLTTVLHEGNRDLERAGFIAGGQSVVYPNTLRHVRCAFRTHDYALKSVEDCRRVYMKAFLDFTRPINESKKLRPYLHHYPVTGDMIELDIIFLDAKEVPFTSPEFARIHNQNGVISYYFWNKQTDQFTIQHAEPFETAKKLYEKELLEARGGTK